jgi:hypothetical protein
MNAIDKFIFIVQVNYGISTLKDEHLINCYLTYCPKRREQSWWSSNHMRLPGDEVKKF